jgi:serine/threonine protein phosphatase 1
LVYRDLEFNIEEPCKEIFIGHTSTLLWKKTEPIHAANIWNLDTGAGSHGKLTIMDVETKQYYQSDLASLLYPNEKGR